MDENKFNELVKKVNQQEETVVQLMKIIAATNEKIADLKQKHEQAIQQLHHSN